MEKENLKKHICNARYLLDSIFVFLKDFDGEVNFNLFEESIINFKKNVGFTKGYYKQITLDKIINSYKRFISTPLVNKGKIISFTFGYGCLSGARAVYYYSERGQSKSFFTLIRWKFI